MPALLTMTLNLSLLAMEVLAAVRTLERELLSISNSSPRPASRKNLQAASPFFMLRTARKKRPPVAANARPVSGPMPEEAPVTMKTLSGIFPSSPSSLMI